METIEIKKNPTPTVYKFQNKERITDPDIDFKEMAEVTREILEKHFLCVIQYDDIGMRALGRWLQCTLEDSRFKGSVKEDAYILTLFGGAFFGECIKKRYGGKYFLVNAGIGHNEKWIIKTDLKSQSTYFTHQLIEDIINGKKLPADVMEIF